ncbi:putative pterin-4-alpha-carbinolamine dehydratase [Actinomycetes bacterium]|nr:putative pterin-4-alpha-carbinolamine dehydratase [Actinomycetes bacterium]
MSPRPLTDHEIDQLAEVLPTWQVAGGQLTREIQAPTFLIAINWVVEIARAAEEIDHHPDIDIRWRTLRLALSTHSTGCLTELDLELAHRIDAIMGS